MLKFQDNNTTVLATFEDFILTVYVVIDDLYHQFAPPEVIFRRHVLDAKLSDPEIITIGIYRIVAETFIPNPYHRPEVNHLDGNKENNAVDNLEWSTQKENTDHSWKTGLTKQPPASIPKAVIQMTLHGKMIQEFQSIKIASDRTYICDGDICRCCKGKRKSAGGYKWKYKEVDTYGN